MSFQCPDWLLRWIGVAPATGEESVLGRLEMLHPLGATVTLLLVALAALVTVRAYYGGEIASRRARYALAGFRLLAILSLLAMLGELGLTLRRAGLPYVVVLIDDSESMNLVDRYLDDKTAKQSAQRLARAFPLQSPGQSTAAEALPVTRWNLVRALLLEDDATFLRRLGEQDYRLQVFTVSEAARRMPSDVEELRQAFAELKAGGQATRLGDGLRAALDELRGRPVAAVVLLSDGVNTAGAMPADAAATAAARNAAVFTVGFGETRKAVDVELAELKYRDRVTINDPVSFDFNVIGRAAEGRKVNVVLRSADDRETLTEKTVTLGPDDAGQAVRLTFRPTETGTFRYVVEAQPLKEEVARTNNRAEASLEVRTDQISVLLVESYPSFEFRYLKQMLGRDPTIRLTCVLQEADPEFSRTDPAVTTVFPVTMDELLKHDVIVFGDVDPEFLGPNSLANLRDFVLEKGRGIIFAAGPRFLPQAYRGTPPADLLPIDWSKSSPPAEVATARGETVRLTPAAVEEPIFQLADDGGDSRSVWRSLAPVYWIRPADLRKSAQVMVETAPPEGSAAPAQPVVAMQRAGRGIVLYHATDETWRWRFRLGDAYFGRYWIQALRYLALAHDGARPYVVRVAQEKYDLGRPVVVEVRFQDERFAPADGVVSVVVEAEGRPAQTVKLAPRRNLRNLFEATLSGLPEGKYRVRLDESPESVAGRAGEGAEQAVTSDEFVVAAARAETFPIEADFASLQAAAETGRGEFFTLADVARLFDRLPRGKLSPTEPLPPVPLWNKWFTILLLVGLLAAEWVLRKRRGLV